jgi:cell division control protein 6
MAGSILGKRNRASLEEAAKSQTRSAAAGNTTRTTRAKRRADFVIAADNEDDNPFLSRKSRKSVHHDHEMDVDDVALENAGASRITVSKRCTPAKHGAAEVRLPLSPAKKNGQVNLVSIHAGEDAKPTTPKTPRHRDALSKKVPVTPRHRSGVFAKSSSVDTPRTPSTPRTSGPSVYNEARQMFARGINPEKLIGREKERQELGDFISQRLTKKRSGCLYISGPPGTGKSALVNEVSAGLEETLSFRRTYVNCMSVKTARDIFSKLLEDFERLHVLEGSETAALEEIFYAGDEAYLVTLDEIDHLLDVDMDLLYKLFEWSLDTSSSLVIVGIANALDFTDRFLPKLKSRGLRPQLLPFMPYSVAQIASVVSSKLKSLLPSATTATSDFVPFIHPMAIQFASKKVAAQTGDLRKAFAICLRAIDLIESETRATLGKAAAELTPSPTPTPSKTPLIENINLSSPVRSPKKNLAPVNPMAHLTMESAPRATIAHMARVTAAVFSNGSTQRLASLNLQQKAVLCSLAALEQKRRDAPSNDIMATPSKSSNAAPTIKALFETYTSLCKNDHVLHPLTSTEFRDVVAGLETSSLVSWIDGKNGTFTNVAPGTPSRRGRGGGFGAKIIEEKRLASSVGNKEIRECLTGAGSGILLALLDGEGI